MVLLLCYCCYCCYCAARFRVGLGLWLAAASSHFSGGAGEFEFILGTDYQEEKLLPHWGKSPQPGPTYFMSKRNVHVHILDAPSCGECSGPSRFGRRIVYSRLEEIGGSKDSNDTISTVYDYLLSPHAPTCEQPVMFRTGYNADGCISVSVEQQPRLQPSGCTGPIPRGHTPVSQPPSEDQLRFRSEAGADLVGATILYKWPHPHGWVAGDILRQNTDARVKLDGSPITFIALYAEEDEEAKHVLDISHHLSIAQGEDFPDDVPDGLWMLLTPMIQACLLTPVLCIEPADFCIPQGYTMQLTCPSAEELAFGSPSGSRLVGNKILCNWGKGLGWLCGEIVSQNRNASISINNAKANFIVAYRDDPKCKHSLQQNSYCTQRNAPDMSWTLLVPMLELPAPEEPPEDVWATFPIVIANISDRLPSPLIRSIRQQMDNCVATNKNQMVIGSQALLVACGILDAFRDDFMKAGHTKFDCDATARQTAGGFRTSDIYNPAMWNHNCQRYATACFYDHHLLRTWKEVQPVLFHAVRNITIYHSFLLLGPSVSCHLCVPCCVCLALLCCACLDDIVP